MFSTEADFARADWTLLRFGAVKLFWNPAILEAALVDLQPLGYEIARVSCLLGQAAFRLQITEALRWQRQFGYAPWTGNLDALDDAFVHYPFGPSGRSALVLDGFHAMVSEDAETARIILDIIETNAREHLLTGKLLLGLIQTADHRYVGPPIGNRMAGWNAREWFNRDRDRGR